MRLFNWMKKTETAVIAPPQYYVIDWDRVKTVKDLKRILKAINISFRPEFEYLEDIKDLVQLKDVPFGNSVEVGSNVKVMRI